MSTQQSSRRYHFPSTYRAAFVRREDAGMFDGLKSSEKDPRKSLKVEEVPIPELADDEALVAVMASSINFNTVWTSIFEPLPTFAFLDRLGRENRLGARHALDYHIVGSDGSGVILRTGNGVRKWKPGDKVAIHCNYVDDQDPTAHDDSMKALNQRIWGFETNFGGLADLAVVKANQLMPKPAHLSWEESAVNALTASTSYRMLVSDNAASMRQGDVVLIWGATGGLGGYAVQLVLNGGGIPIGVVSSPEKAELLHKMGCEAVIDRKGRELPVLVRSPHPGRIGVAAVSARRSANWSGKIPRSCSSIPVVRPWGHRSSSAPGAEPWSPVQPHRGT